MTLEARAMFTAVSKMDMQRSLFNTQPSRFSRDVPLSLPGLSRLLTDPRIESTAAAEVVVEIKTLANDI